VWEVESKLMEKIDVNDFKVRGVHPSKEGF
jgi:hypothetical protein